MAPLKKGAAMVATELGIPIVPAYVHGTYASLPKYGKFPKPRRICVHFGQVIDPSREAEGNSGSRLSYTEITNKLTARIIKLNNLHQGR